LSNILTKQQLSKLIKENILWPGWDYHIQESVKAVDSPTGQGGRASSHTYYSRVEENIVNQELDAVVEILIDQLYQRYLDIERWVEIFDPNLADSDKECVALYAPNHGLKYGDKIRIYNTLNYNREFEVLNTDGDGNQDYILVPSSYSPEELSDSCYYTIVSLDGYSESDYKYFGSAAVHRCDSPRLEAPVFLPLLGQKVGYTYDPSKSIAVNRKLIQNAIDIYKIKGSITSIKRVMRLLGYDCEVYEPYVDIFRYNISTYDGPHRIQNWDFYHHGVFEIITNDVPLSAYKSAIASTVQPAGTRLVSAVMETMNLVPFIIGTGLPQDQKSIHVLFVEMIAKSLKAGDLFDGFSPRRSRSGSREVTGFYKDLGIDIYSTAFRRVWDSHIFSFAELAEKVWKEKPAAIFSTSRGVKSGPVRTFDYGASEYTEQSPFDLQLHFDVNPQQLRLPQRSMHAVRSGSFVASGQRGTGVPLSRYWIRHHGPVLSDAIFSNENCHGFDRLLGIDLGLVGGVVPEEEGTRFDEDRVLSGGVNLFGFELTIERRYDILDWADRLPYMYDDECRLIKLYDADHNFVWRNYLDFGTSFDPTVAKDFKEEVIYFDDSSRSGRQTAYGFQVQPAMFWDLGTYVRYDDDKSEAFDFDRVLSGGDTARDFEVDIVRDPERWDRQLWKEKMLHWEERLARSYRDTANLVQMYSPSYQFVKEPFEVSLFTEPGYSYLRLNDFDSEGGRRSGLGIAEFGFEVKISALKIEIADWADKQASLYSDRTPLVRVSTIETNYAVTPFTVDLGVESIPYPLPELIQDYSTRSGTTYFDADVKIVVDPGVRGWREKLTSSYTQDANVVPIYSEIQEFMWDRFDIHIHRDASIQTAWYNQQEETERSGYGSVADNAFDVIVKTLVVVVEDWNDKRAHMFPDDSTPLVNLWDQPEQQTRDIKDRSVTTVSLVNFATGPFSSDIEMLAEPIQTQSQVFDEAERSGTGTQAWTDVHVVQDEGIRGFTDKKAHMFPDDSANVVMAYETTKEFMWDRFDIVLSPDPSAYIDPENEFDLNARPHGFRSGAAYHAVVDETFNVQIDAKKLTMDDWDLKTQSMLNSSANLVQMENGNPIIVARAFEIGSTVSIITPADDAFEETERSGISLLFDFDVQTYDDTQRLEWWSKFAESYDNLTHLATVYDLSKEFMWDRFHVDIQLDSPLTGVDDDVFEDTRRSGQQEINDFSVQIEDDSQLPSFEITDDSWKERLEASYIKTVILVTSPYTMSSSGFEVDISFLSSSDRGIDLAFDSFDAQRSGGTEHVESSVVVVSDEQLKLWLEKLSYSYSQEASVATVYTLEKEFMWDRFDVHIVRDSELTLDSDLIREDDVLDGTRRSQYQAVYGIYLEIHRDRSKPREVKTQEPLKKKGSSSKSKKSGLKTKGKKKDRGP
jgi:hypothetical protein